MPIYMNYFLKIDGIPGESQDLKHKGEIEILSWSWGETQMDPRGGAGKVAMQDLHFTRVIDKASPLLMDSCASGKHLPNAVLSCRKAGEKQQDFFVIKLSDALISSYSIGASQNAFPSDEFSINFLKMHVDLRGSQADVNNP
jgi:type VI secretion system secreted protein Hcp